jgi:hypothetical protein
MEATIAYDISDSLLQGSALWQLNPSSTGYYQSNYQQKYQIHRTTLSQKGGFNVSVKKF